MRVRKKVVTGVKRGAETARQMGMGKSLPNQIVAIDERGSVYILLATIVRVT